MGFKNFKLPEVVNKYKSAYDVYCGRGSKYGNPFPINESIGDTREVVIGKFESHFWEKLIKGQWTVDEIINDLAGKKIACFCKPKACHLDVFYDFLECIQWLQEDPYRYFQEVRIVSATERENTGHQLTIRDKHIHHLKLNFLTQYQEELIKGLNNDK